MIEKKHDHSTQIYAPPIQEQTDIRQCFLGPGYGCVVFAFGLRLASRIRSLCRAPNADTTLHYIDTTAHIEK